jgi:hypothetical protein
MLALNPMSQNQAVRQGVSSRSEHPIQITDRQISAGAYSKVDFYFRKS